MPLLASITNNLGQIIIESVVNEHYSYAGILLHETKYFITEIFKNIISNVYVICLFVKITNRVPKRDGRGRLILMRTDSGQNVNKVAHF